MYFIYRANRNSAQLETHLLIDIRHADAVAPAAYTEVSHLLERFVTLLTQTLVLQHTGNPIVAQQRAPHPGGVQVGS